MLDIVYRTTHGCPLFRRASMAAGRIAVSRHAITGDSLVWYRSTKIAFCGIAVFGGIPFRIKRLRCGKIAENGAIPARPAVAARLPDDSFRRHAHRHRRRREMEGRARTGSVRGIQEAPEMDADAGGGGGAPAAAGAATEGPRGRAAAGRPPRKIAGAPADRPG